MPIIGEHINIIDTNSGKITAFFNVVKKQFDAISIKWFVIVLCPPFELEFKYDIRKVLGICIDCVQNIYQSPHLLYMYIEYHLHLVFTSYGLQMYVNCIHINSVYTMFCQALQSSISMLYTVYTHNIIYTHSHIFHLQSLELTFFCFSFSSSSFFMSFFAILIYKRDSISLSRFSVYRILEQSPHIHLCVYAKCSMH